MVLVIIFLLFVNRILSEDIRKLKKLVKQLRENERKEQKRSRSSRIEFENLNLRKDIEDLTIENRKLRDALIDAQRSYYENNQSQKIYSEEIVEAVKKAMIYSHPDKGNCSTSDDFIKYKKIYDNLKGENNNGKQHY